MLLVSLTKYVLIVYAEGLACNNFDKKTIYNVMGYDKDTCYVLKKSADEKGKPNSTNRLFFCQVPAHISMMVICRTFVVVYRGT